MKAAAQQAVTRQEEFSDKRKQNRYLHRRCDIYCQHGRPVDEQAGRRAVSISLP
jgi:hypothetical protein